MWIGILLAAGLMGVGVGIGIAVCGFIASLGINVSSRGQIGIGMVIAIIFVPIDLLVIILSV